MTQTRSILARFRTTDERLVRCCHAMGRYLYVGTGPDGILYRSTDGFSFSEFYKTGDMYVTSVCDYGNALFVGTSPGGYILMHNFNTGNRFHYVTTGDYQVTAMVVHNDRLYAGTSPSGMIFSFDGNNWVMEYDSYGAGIIDMVSDGTDMYVFVQGVEFVPCLKDTGWELLHNGEDSLSISSFSKAKTSLSILAKNANFDTSFSCACVAGDKLFFAPENKCNLYMFDGTEVSIVHQWHGTRIWDIENIGDEQIAIAVDDTVYVTAVGDIPTISEGTTTQQSTSDPGTSSQDTSSQPSQDFTGGDELMVESQDYSEDAGMSEAMMEGES